MRVLFLTPGAHGGHGGIAQCNQDVIEALSVMSEIERVFVLPRIVDNQFDFASLPKKIEYYCSRGGKLNYFFSYIKLLVFLKKIDVVICAHVNLAPLAWIAAKRFRAKCCLLIYGVEVWRSPRRLKAYFANQHDVVISISQFTLNKSSAWLRSKKHFVLPLSVDVKKFSLGAKNADLLKKLNLSEKKIIFTLARLDQAERYKGIDEVLDLMSELLKVEPNLIYLIGGKGNDLARLEEKVKKLNLTQHVRFLGYVSEQEKIEFYRSVDLFVMPGRGEGFGLVYLEALACGLPVVGSCLDASYETLLEGDLGFVPNPDDSFELKQSILFGLSCEKGQVPKKLDFYTKFAFQNRVKDILNRL